MAKECDTSGVAGFYGGLSASLIMVANPALRLHSTRLGRNNNAVVAVVAVVVIITVQLAFGSF